MAKTKKMVSVAYANTPAIKVELDTVKKWKPTNITKLTGFVCFNIGGQMVSMEAKDYYEIFGE